MNRIDGSKIKLFQLRALVAVANFGSFGKAGVELGLTQSAISHAIASLEAELGVVLLQRGSWGASLTPVGSTILDQAQQILHHLDRLVEQTEAARGLEAGQVRLAAIRSLATHWLPHVIATFKQRHPQIEVTVTRCVNHGEVQIALHQGNADVGLMDIDSPQGLDIIELFTDDYLALFPPQAQLSEPITWAQLQRYPLILPVPDDNSYARLRQYLCQLLVQPQIAYEVNEDSAIVSMVAEGLGMAILPYLAAIPIPKTVQVRPLPQPLKRQLAATVLAAGLHSPAVYAFLDVAREMRSWLDPAERLAQ